MKKYSLKPYSAALFIGIVVVAAILFYALSEQQTGSQPDQTNRRGEIDMDTQHKLFALGYLQGYKTARQDQSVTVYKKEHVHSGLNFYTSGHAPEAYLMDMEGTVLHAWRYKNASQIWPREKPSVSGSYWRRAHLYENGDILAVYEGIGLIKLDKHSNLLWSYAPAKKPHHDLQVTDNGTIYLLTRQKQQIPRQWSPGSVLRELKVMIQTGSLTKIFKKKYLLEDFITILDHRGNEIKNISILDLVKQSPYARLMDRSEIIKQGGFLGNGDIFHTNTLEIFDGRLAHKARIFKKGNIIISVLVLNTIFIIDMEKQKIVWALGSGMWNMQHQPTLLDSGNILIFDNFYTPNTSNILEFEPFTQKIIWNYNGNTGNPFFSRTCGSNQRLPNGNTLISETDNSRAFEVTPGKEIVWEFINPARTGKNKDLSATIPEMIRVPEDYGAFVNR